MNPTFLTDCAWKAFAIIRQRLHHSAIPLTPAQVSTLCERCFRIERRFLERPARSINRLENLADFPDEQRWEVTIMGHRPYRVTYHEVYHFCMFEPACPVPFQIKLQDELYRHMADLCYGMKPRAKAA